MLVSITPPTHITRVKCRVSTKRLCLHPAVEQTCHRKVIATMKSLKIILLVALMTILYSFGGKNYHIIYSHTLCVLHKFQMYSSSCLDGTGVECIPFQILPQGIQSVNGSNETMGCTSPLVVRDGVMVCDCTSSSFLVDGISPNITTSDNDWAAQLVTVRRNEGNSNIGVFHVLLTFVFDTAVSPTGIEIDFFHCPDLGIGAPRISVFINEEYDLTFNISLPFRYAVTTTESDCDSLSTVMVSPHPGSYHIFHILVTFDTEPIPIDWVYVGEVRFLGLHDEGDG